jgi:glycosyltransferase involved in cell wall biosynthesis
MLRVVIISTLPPIQTGESPYTESLIRELEQYEDIDIHAISTREADILESKSGRVHTHRIWNPHDPLYPFRLCKKIGKLRPHLVHVQFGPDKQVFGGFFGEPMLLLLLLLRASGIKTTVTLHSTWMPYQVKERVQGYGILGRLALLAGPVFRLYNRFLDWGTTTIQLSTTTMHSFLRAYYLRCYKVSSRKVLEIPHPCQETAVLPDTEDAKSELGLEGRRVALVFGFIRRGKGIETGIKAMESVRTEVEDALLLIAGRPLDSDGEEYLRELEALQRRLHLQDCVEFRSKYIEESTVPLYFAAAEVILLPYGESVGASGPAHNYAGHGVPIIASDVGLHMRDTLGGNLLLFKRGNSDSLARILVYLLQSPDRREQIGDRVRAYAADETWEVAAERTLKNYSDTLSLR